MASSPSSSTSSSKRKSDSDEKDEKDGEAKKAKFDESGESLYARTAASRLAFADSVSESPVNKKRIRIMTSTTTMLNEEAEGGIMYWMVRDQRVEDNWALLHAQSLALKHSVPLHVVVGLIPNKLHLINLRMAAFQIKGLQEVEEDCNRLSIHFNLLQGTNKEMPNVVKFAKDNNVKAVVTDFSPLRHPQKWLKSVAEKLDEKDIPLWQVDAHNVVPCWQASPKLEVGARTIRTKIHKQLGDFLKPFPPVLTHPHSDPKQKPSSIDWQGVIKNLLDCGLDESVRPIKWAVGGSKAAFVKLEEFANRNLKRFAADRNDPNKNVLSNLSPWITYGHISMQRCILHVNPLKSKASEGVDAYVEEAVIRKELSDNFCFYQPKYDSLEGAANWAKESLAEHEKDKRDYVYTLKQFTSSETHDPLWNAAQTQLRKEGKMHGFMRMYWAKKILEWASTPAEALKIAIHLNDSLAVDGRCPNGYVGCMWSIVGTHDQGWKERPVFGKIRYMNYAGCKRKFDVSAFEAKYGGKVNHMKSQKNKD